MSVENVKSLIGDYGKDIRLNLENILTEEGAPGLTKNQIIGTALACAYSTGNNLLIDAVKAAGPSSPELEEGAKQAATIMAMNNVYYRFNHFMEGDEIAKLPAKLRMTVIGKPAVPKADFEAMCLAVSAINGCEMCVKSHVNELRKHGIIPEGIQATARIAAVIQAAHAALKIATNP